MLPNCKKGFVLTEALISLSIFLTITLTLIPIIQQVKSEQYDQLVYSKMLSAVIDELYLMINKELPSPSTKEMVINNVNATIEISSFENYWQGCISWTSLKNLNESMCFYAPVKE